MLETETCNTCMAFFVDGHTFKVHGWPTETWPDLHSGWGTGAHHALLLVFMQSLQRVLEEKWTCNHSEGLIMYLGIA